MASAPQQTDRALRILDALIKACDVRGFRWEVGTEGTRVLCNGEKIRIRLWETLTKQPIPPPSKTPGKKGRWQGGDDNFYYPRYEWAATGRLSIQVEDRVDNHARRNWSGTATIPLEAKLHEIVAGLPVVADGIRLARERHEAWRREFEEEQARRKEAARQAEIQRRLRARLVRSLEQWERSGRLLAFCDAARREVEKLPDIERKSAEGWLYWAIAHAQALNPLGQRLMDVSDMNVSVEGWYHNEYQQPQPDWWTKPLRN